MSRLFIENPIKEGQEQECFIEKSDKRRVEIFMRKIKKQIEET